MPAAIGFSVSYLLDPFPPQWNEQRTVLLPCVLNRSSGDVHLN